MIDDFLAWYLAPWRRIGRAPFNTAVVVATIPSMVLSLTGMVEGAKGLLGPLMGLMGGGSGGGTPDLAGMMNGDFGGGNGGGPDPAQLQKALDQLQQGASAPAPHGVAWGDVLDSGIWLALLPLVMMRLRDMGKSGVMLWVFIVLLYAPILMQLAAAFAGDVFGTAQTVAGFVSFVLLAWMCVAKSHREERPADAAYLAPRAPMPPPGGMTGGGNSGKVGPDDAYTP
jgi:uncharacterized membrane protein YhaH (DUF805 family)